MTQVLHPLPLAGDYLVATFSDLMHSTRFRRHVWDKMHLDERLRLESLRLQAVYGDAPSYTGKRVSAPKEEATAGAKVKGAERKAAAEAKAASPPSPALQTSAKPSPPRWFDIAGRARYNAWVTLRGRMSPDVAAECFCAEFLGIIRKYPHPALLPPVEAALSTAHGLAQRVRSNSHNSSRNAKPARLLSASMSVLQVRALQGDPAALALLWICRAYRIPCEFVVEPLSKALGRLTAASAAHPYSTADLNSISNAAAAVNPYLPYTLADACYPFSASFVYPQAAASASTMDASGATSVATTTVTTPEAAFVLMKDIFLAAYPHWMGVPSDPHLTSPTSPSQPMLQRCSWIDELQHITRHVRTPILALLVHHATQLLSPSNHTASADRANLRRAVAAHLHRYESWTMEKVVQRRVGQAQSVLSPLLASTAVVDALQHVYAPDAKAVTAADVFVASCGYVLCTHPFCADVFPLLRVPVNHLNDGEIQSQWPSNGTSAVPAKTETKPTISTSATATTYVPWALPLYISGLPAEYNDKINRLLRREAKGATQHEQRRQPVRLLLNDNSEVSLAKDTNSGSVSAAQHGCPKYYEVSSASVTKEAAEAVGQLILTRISSLRNDDLQHGDGDVGISSSNSSVSGVPFLVLGQVFALTWALAQEQVPAFPYFMLDGNPGHFGGFSFLTEEAEETRRNVCGKRSVAGASTSSRSHPRFQVSLAPSAAVHDNTYNSATGNTNPPVSAMLPGIVPGSTPTASASSQDGGVSIESRLRNGIHGVGAVVMKSVRRLMGSPREEESQAGRNSGVHATHVLRSEGHGNVGCGRGGAAAAAMSNVTVGPAHL